MAYDSTDPRATLAAPTKAGDVSGAAVALPALYEFRPDNARPTPEGTSWLIRAQNLVLEYTTLEPGTAVAGFDDPDESVALTVSDTADLTVSWSDETVRLQGQALAVIPPGRSFITAHTPLHLVRLYTTTLTERSAAASNAADYAAPHPQVSQLRPWPAPSGEPTLRRYALSDFPPQPGRFGSIFRTRAFMVNFLPTAIGPRDPNTMSPHTHDDFEQISLAVDGEFVHHIRTPWSPRRPEWVDDVHWRTAAPSVAIIPPPTVHTSENVADELNALIDIFSPPRADFSAKTGWVLNADDYPLPESVSAW